MNFPNAYKGISRILTAQWIQVICSILTIIGVVLTAGFSLNAADPGAETGISGAIVAVAMVFGIIAIIMNLVGINNARKDDPQFSTAFIFCILSLILGIVAVVIQFLDPVIAGWVSFVQKILSLAVIEYVVAGCISLAAQLKNEAVAGLGKTIRIIITILYCIAIVSCILGNVAASFDNILSIADVVLEMVVFIVYIVFLTRAKSMLA